jgi:magnesium-transporting ATPase (P-type)
MQIAAGKSYALGEDGLINGPEMATDLSALPTTDPQAVGPGDRSAWHALDAETTLEQLGASRNGLTPAEAEARLARFGPNTLPHKPPPTIAEILLRQFKSPLIYLLGAAAAVSLALGEVKDAAFIFGVLLINAIIGTVQEAKAEKASQALQKLLQIRAAVRRGGQVRDISAEDVVPGDIVFLESGNRVPADLRILSSHGLEADESLLTGESLAVAKNASWTGPADTPLGDQINMMRAGSIVARGRCQGVVVSTGMHTVIGSLARDVLESEAGKPPLIERMESFTRKIAMLVVSAAVLIAVGGVLFGGYSITEMFMFGVALAVSAVPEGLPVALTVALAIGTTRMAKRHVIVRRLAAVEGLGSCTLIASDKTGTLTCNELTVRELRLPDGTVYTVTGEGFVPDGRVCRNDVPIEPGEARPLDGLCRGLVLCNEGELLRTDNGWIWHGDPTDVALLTMAYKLGWRRENSLELHPEINDIPFEPERQYAASYHCIDDAVRVLVKGAPERVLDMSADPQDTRDRVRAMAADMAASGYRVLAVAEGAAPSDLRPDDAPPPPEGLTCLGLVGMIDPLRPGVAEAVDQARLAGVRTIMVTGDHPVTALAIARSLGLAEHAEQVTTGTEIDDAGDDALAESIGRTRVFSRVAPHQKLEIVKAAQHAGHFVAVTGDGVNDAPALRAANIGVAMGESGTDVAREAAELVISDDHFGTITAGIEEGRIAYDNIRNVIYLLISTGAAEVVLVALALMTGSPIPLLPVQLLWLNLVTNGIQDVALAFEPGAPDVLQRRPRPPGEPIFNRLMIERTVIAALFMGIVGFGLFDYGLAAGWTEAEARNALLLLMVLFENVHIFNCRSETQSAFARSPLESPFLMIGMVLAFSIHVLMMHLPIGQTLLSAEPVSADRWLLLLSLALPILFVMELHKLSWRWRSGPHEGLSR